MSYEKLEQAINALFMAEKTLKDNTSLFKRYIADQSIPLNKRWDFWLLAPSSLKDNNGYISSGRLEAFRILGVDPRDAICNDGPFIYAERYQTFDMANLLERVIEAWTESGNEVDDDYDWGEFAPDDEVLLARDFPLLSEFIVAYKEEVLRKNLESFKYDW